ncbi:unnamed protein product [Cylicocyclus nassatus]|uniref:Peptidase S1 domain-containing protein n=1 Tax=Cylicocyclus nassatus TaxID=53992 RepID=A0AA36MH27_CYLNA|nr:unnamed protein product [Cylicocyclus nassatus]
MNSEDPSDFKVRPIITTSPVTSDHHLGDFSHGQQVVALRYHTVDQLLQQIQTKTFAKGIFAGDCGGPLFQVNQEGRHILVGINSAIDETSIEHHQNMVNYFTDVRANLDWICKHSGALFSHFFKSSANSAEMISNKKRFEDIVMKAACNEELQPDVNTLKQGEDYCAFDGTTISES